MYEIEHSYIDFSYTIIGKKIKGINDFTKKSFPKFNDVFYT